MKYCGRLFKMIVESSTIIDKELERCCIPRVLNGRKVLEIATLTAFNSKIRELIFEEGSDLVKIGTNAFARCLHLTNITFPASLKTISKGSFMYCEELENIVFPLDSQLRSIGENVFMSCKKLKDVKFPQKLEYIGGMAFFYCFHTEELDLSKSNIRYVGGCAFADCLKKIILPTNIPRIHKVFSSINFNIVDRELINIVEWEGSSMFLAKDSCGVVNCSQKIICSDTTRKRIMIRRGVTKILRKAFDKSLVQRIFIPASVEKICNFTFYKSELKFVFFDKDSKLRVIGSSAFYGTKIREVSFPKSVKVIKSGAFSNCAMLTKVNFPVDSALEELEGGSFYGTGIKRINFPKLLKNIKDIGIDLNYDFSTDFIEASDGIVYTKNRSEVLFSSTTEIPDGPKVIQSGAFANSCNCSKFILPPSVTKIFSIPDCVVKLDLSKNLGIKEIPDKSLSARYLRYVYLPPSVEKIGINAVSNIDCIDCFCIENSNFKTNNNGVVTSLVPNSIIFVHRNLNSIDIDPNLEIIHSYAFNCSSMKKIFLPKSLKVIGSHAFGRSSLTHVEFEEGMCLREFQTCAFERTLITEVKFPYVSDLIGYNVFSFTDFARESGETGFTYRFPPNMATKKICDFISIFHAQIKIIIPRSSLNIIKYLPPNNNTVFEIIEDAK